MGTLQKVRWLAIPLVFLSLCPLAFAQQRDEETWPQVSKEDLALKDNPADPGASAMILYRGVTDDDVKGFGTEVYCIKVFSEEGKKYADIEISYIPKVREVEDIRARVIQPDGQIEDFNGQIFDKTSVKFKKFKLQVKAFTLPDVRAGSVIEYSYKIRWRWKEPDYMKNPGQYTFTAQWTIPTVGWEIQEELYTRRARFSLRPFPGSSVSWSVHSLPSSETPQRRLDGTLSLDVDNVPAYREEEFMPPEGAAKSSIRFYYYIGGHFSPDSYWSSIGKFKGEAFEKFLDKRKAMENAVKNIISPGDSDTVKLQKIYARVQRIRYLGYEYAKTGKEEKKEDIRENKNVEDVLKHGYAQMNEINLLFIGLARAAGFEAWPVSVASRESVFFDKNYLDASQLNAMVVRVRLGSNNLFLDPATLYCPFDLLPWSETGTTGLRLDKGGGILVNMPQAESSDARIRREAHLRLDKDGTVQGRIHVVFVGQEALNRRLDEYQKDGTGRKKDLEDEVKGWLPMGATVTLTSSPEWEKTAQTLEADFDIKIPNFGAQAGHHWVVPLAVCEGSQKYPFQSALRINPVYFHTPYQEIDEVSLKAPAGYSIENLPAGRRINSGFSSYATTFLNKGGTVQFERSLIMEGDYFQTQYYPNLKSFFDSVRSGDGDQIVLKGEEPNAKK